MTKEERLKYFQNFDEKERGNLISEGAVILSLGFDIVDEGDDYKIFEKQIKFHDDDSPSIDYYIKCHILFYEDRDSEYSTTVSLQKKTPFREYEVYELPNDKSSDAGSSIYSCMCNISDCIRAIGLVQDDGKDFVDFKDMTRDGMKKEIDERIHSVFEKDYQWIVPENADVRFAWEDMRRFWNEKKLCFDTSNQVR